MVYPGLISNTFLSFSNTRLSTLCFSILSGEIYTKLPFFWLNYHSLKPSIYRAHFLPTRTVYRWITAFTILDLNFQEFQDQMKQLYLCRSCAEFDILAGWAGIPILPRKRLLTTASILTERWAIIMFKVHVNFSLLLAGTFSTHGFRRDVKVRDLSQLAYISFARQTYVA